MAMVVLVLVATVLMPWAVWVSRCTQVKFMGAAALAGVRRSEVAEIINGPIRDAGYGDYCRPPYMRVRGHGLGLTSNLPGDVAVTNDIELEEGMVFVMHPNQYLPETGYLMCGEPVVITPDGARALSTGRAEPDAVPI